mgnify:CR=1 FL=1
MENLSIFEPQEQLSMDVSTPATFDTMFSVTSVVV